jgi:hypothetical protein
MRSGRGQADRRPSATAPRTSSTLAHFRMEMNAIRQRTRAAGEPVTAGTLSCPGRPRHQRDRRHGVRRHRPPRSRCGRPYLDVGPSNPGCDLCSARRDFDIASPSPRRDVNQVAQLAGAGSVSGPGATRGVVRVRGSELKARIQQNAFRDRVPAPRRDQAAPLRSLFGISLCRVSRTPSFDYAAARLAR